MADPAQGTGESIERIMTVETRPAGVPSSHRLYQAAKDQEGGPLAMAAAKALRDELQEGDTVIIATGANAPPWFPVGETDGPLGAVGLARALALSQDVRPVITAEERYTGPIETLTNACGLNTVPYEQHLDRKHAATVVPYTTDETEAERTANDFFDTYDPSAILAVEKLGPNEDGIINTLAAVDRTEHMAKIGNLFDKAEEEDVLTVGIGDGGNEVGMAKIKDAVEKYMPRGEIMGTRLATDKLVVGGSSNLGAYAVAANLAILEEMPEALHDPSHERRMLDFATVEGLADGTTTRPTATVDGMSQEGMSGAVAILNNIVRQHFNEVDKSLRDWDEFE